MEIGQHCTFTCTHAFICLNFNPSVNASTLPQPPNFSFMSWVPDVSQRREDSLMSHACALQGLLQEGRYSLDSAMKDHRERAFGRKRVSLIMIAAWFPGYVK